MSLKTQFHELNMMSAKNLRAHLRDEFGLEDIDQDLEKQGVLKLTVQVYRNGNNVLHGSESFLKALDTASDPWSLMPDGSPVPAGLERRVVVTVQPREGEGPLDVTVNGERHRLPRGTQIAIQGPWFEALEHAKGETLRVEGEGDERVEHWDPYSAEPYVVHGEVLCDKKTKAVVQQLPSSQLMPAPLDPVLVERHVSPTGG